ncbi:hypothetical protein I552_7622 [Mycobacterium xenopi 3993]|nr:hypothetical protein I552_7622 [Mycobacterium xenopi 3993]
MYCGVSSAHCAFRARDLLVGKHRRMRRWWGPVFRAGSQPCREGYTYGDDCST